MKKTFSAGGVVLNAKGEVLVVNQNGDSWSLPKGHIDPGETAQTAAAREIQEEAGLRQLVFIKELGSYERRQIGPGGIGETGELKHIVFFLYSTDEQELKPEDPRNPEARWIKPENVAKLLTHPKDREFFESVLPEVKNLQA